MNDVKFRTFVKTYLHCKGKCTSKQLASAYNEIGFERHDITSRQVGSFLVRELNKAHRTTCLHESLKFEMDGNLKIWYLAKGR